MGCAPARLAPGFSRPSCSLLCRGPRPLPPPSGPALRPPRAPASASPAHTWPGGYFHVRTAAAQWAGATCPPLARSASSSELGRTWSTCDIDVRVLGPSPPVSETGGGPTARSQRRMGDGGGGGVGQVRGVGERGWSGCPGNGGQRDVRSHGRGPRRRPPRESARAAVKRTLRRLRRQPAHARALRPPRRTW